MIQQTRLLIVLLNLLICLCLGSVAILPMSRAVGSPIMEMAASDAEGGSWFEQLETEDDFSFGLTSWGIAIGLSFSKHGTARPGFRAAVLSPVIPPPKPV